MILGIISLILDFLVPISSMFLITFIILSLYYRKNIKISLILLLIYSIFNGMFYYNLFYFLTIYYFFNYVSNRNIKNSLITLLLSLSFYDIFLYLFLYFIKKLSISFIIIKVLFSLVINYLYLVIIYLVGMVLKSQKLQYKLM